MSTELDNRPGSQQSDRWHDSMQQRMELAAQESGQKGDTLGKGFTSEEKQRLRDISKTDGMAAHELRSKEDQRDTPEDGFFKGNYKKGKRNVKAMVARRTAGGVLGAASLLTLLGLGGISSGPFAIINAAASLKPNFALVEDQSDQMTTRAMIYMLLGNANRGRLGIIATRVADKYEAKILRELGVAPVYDNTRTNRIAGYRVVDQGAAERSGIINQLTNSGVSSSPAGSEIKDARGNVIADGEFLDMRDGNTRSKRVVTRMVGNATSSKGITKFFMNRLSVKRSGTKLSVFSGLKDRADARLRDQMRAGIRDTVANGVDSDVQNTRAGPSTDSDGDGVADSTNQSTEDMTNQTNEAADSAREGVKSENGKADFKAKMIAGPLAVVGTLCMVNSVSDGYRPYVYEKQILPLMRFGGMFSAAGSQAQTSVDNDLNLEEMGEFAEMYLYDSTSDIPDNQRSFTDNVANRTRNGQSGGAPVPGEADIRTDKPTVFQVFDEVFSYIPAADLTCDVVNGVGEIISSIPGVDWLMERSSEAIAVGLNAVGVSIDDLTGMLYQFVGGPEAITQLAGGAAGAAADAGSQLLANDQATGYGGEPLSSIAYNKVFAAAQQEIAYTNSQKSFYDRYFSLKNDNSLAFRALQNTPTSITSIARSIVTIPDSSAKSVASITNSKVNAASSVYQHTMPYTGFTDEEMNHPLFEDPFAIEEYMMQPGVLEDLNSRYGDCYGTTINPDTGALITGEAVNPLERYGGELDYCNDQGNIVSSLPGVPDAIVQQPIAYETRVASTGVLAATTRPVTDKLMYRQYLATAVNIHSLACLEGLAESCDSMYSSAGAEGNDNSAIPSASGGYGAEDAQLEGLPQECRDGTASGSVRLLCVGAKYRDKVPYSYGAGHVSGKQNSEAFAAGGANLAFDCSSYVSTTIWDAYGVDMMAATSSFANATDSATGNKLFERVELSQGRPGDLAVAPGSHIGIILVNGETVLDANTTHANSPIDDVGIHRWSSTAYQFALRYIGPNAEGSSVQVGGNNSTGSTTTPGSQSGQGIQLDGIDDLIIDNQFTANRSIVPRVDNIVIHWFVGNNESPAGVANSFSGGTSIQFFVSEEGKIMQLTEFANSKAGHAKNANDWTIGIEIGSPSSDDINFLEQTLLNNERQKQQVIKLTTALVKKFGITNITIGDQTLYTQSCRDLGLNFSGTCATQTEASQFGIVGHYQLQNSKSDPGKTYIKQIQQAVKNNL